MLGSDFVTVRTARTSITTLIMYGSTFSSSHFDWPYTLVVIPPEGYATQRDNPGPSAHNPGTTA
jgi:hypothetical protein